MTQRSLFKHLYHNVLPLPLKNVIEEMREPRRKIKNVYNPQYCASKSIFVHIPKTAGTSVSEALYGMQPWHHLARSYQQVDPQRFEEYFSFAFVRNPWDRALSIYKYARKISDSPYRGPLTDIAGYDSFESFVMDWCEKEKIQDHYFLRSQFSFVSIDDESVGIDFLGRFENIDEDFKEVCRNMGVDVALPKLNQAKKKEDFRQSYTTEMVDKIASVYNDDVEKLGYSFE